MTWHTLRTGARDHATTAQYDPSNQLTSLSYSDGVTPNVSYGYDADGQRLSMTDGTGTSKYTYDTLGRLTQTVDGAGHTITNAYDLDGNRTSITYPNASVETLTYDRADRVAQIKDWLGHSTTFSYDANSNLTSETYPNWTTSALTYDRNDALTQVIDSKSGTPFWTFGYTRDALSQLSTAADPLTTPSSQHTYSYDVLNRLTGDSTATATTSWNYDAADNLTGITDSLTGTSTLVYDAAHELTNLSTTFSGRTTHNLTLSYNSNGNRTGQNDSVTGTSASFGYDQANRMTSYSQGSTTASYAYNGNGLRTSKTVNGVAAAEVWDTTRSIPVLIQDGSTNYIAGPTGLPLEQINGTAVTWYYQDQLGSTRGLLDSTGTSVVTYTYTAYGTVASHTGSTTSPFGYAGQYTDAESGLQYLRARYYDPATQQFLTVDPLVAQTGEPYAYVAGQLLNATDPLGCSAAVRSFAV